MQPFRSRYSFLRSQGEGTASNKEPELGGPAVYLSKREKLKKTRGNPQQKRTSMNFRLGRIKPQRSRAGAAGMGGPPPDVTLGRGVPTAITANNTSGLCFAPLSGFFCASRLGGTSCSGFAISQPPGVQMGLRRLEPAFRCLEEEIGAVGWLRYQGRRCSEVQKGPK